MKENMRQKFLIAILLLVSLIFMPESGRAIAHPDNGALKQYYPGGQLKFLGRYKDGQLVLSRSYYPNGKLRTEYRYKDKRAYLIRQYYESGQLKSIWTKKSGVSKTFYPDGRLKVMVNIDPPDDKGSISSFFSP